MNWNDDAEQNWKTPLLWVALRTAAAIAVVTAMSVTLTAIVCGGLR